MQRVNSTDNELCDHQTTIVSYLMSRPREICYLQGGFSTGKAFSFPSPRGMQTKRDRKLQFCTVKMAVLWKAALVQAEVLTLWIAKVLQPALLWEILLKGSNLQQESIWYKSKRMIQIKCWAPAGLKESPTQGQCHFKYFRIATAGAAHFPLVMRQLEKSGSS